MSTAALPIAIFHEHPDWFRPLFAELERRGIPYVRLDAASHRFDPSEREAPYSLVVNRASPSAYLRAHGQTTFYTLHLLRHLERLGVPVVNGSHVYGLEISKATQLDLLTELQSAMNTLPSGATHTSAGRNQLSVLLTISSRSTSKPAPLGLSMYT